MKYVIEEVHALREEKVMATGGKENEPGLLYILILLKRDQVKMCSFFVGPSTALLATPVTLNLFGNLTLSDRSPPIEGQGTGPTV